MLPLSYRPKKNSTSPGHRLVWSPTQEIMESPCTKIIKDRKNAIRARALLNKFMEIRMEADAEKEKKGKDAEKADKPLYF